MDHLRCRLEHSIASLAHRGWLGKTWARNLDGTGFCSRVVDVGERTNRDAYLRSAMVLGVPTDAGPGTVDMNPPSMLQPEAGRMAGAALAPRDGYWHYKHTTRIVEE